MKKILIIGNRAREHALAWKLKQSPEVGEIFIAPGNVGTALVGTNVPIEVTDIDDFLEFAKKEKINLTILGSDEPGPLGIVDQFQKEGLMIFGPTQGAAQIEASKAFAKQLMKEEGIPTAAFEIFTDDDNARAYADSLGAPLVVKASGLAQGKGAMICKTPEEAHAALKEIMVDRVFGDAGNEVVIEEFLEGQEISIHAFSDGKTFKLFPTSQDHKPIGDGDTGLNTGGMGTIAPVPWADDELMEKVKVKVVKPALEGLKKRGSPFAGILYPGLMIVEEDTGKNESENISLIRSNSTMENSDFLAPKTLEFNARFGDPEAQSYMRLLKSDLLPILEACVNGTLDKIDIEWHSGHAVCIVIASSGYPEEYKKGFPITGIEEAEKIEDAVVFHAGTKMENGTLVTAGGRVLSVTATGKTLEEALEKAYAACSKIHFDGMYYRKDIGRRKPPQFLIQKKNPPKILTDVGLSMFVDTVKLRDVGAPVEEIDIADLLWHFDMPVWDKDGTDDWNCTPWEVVRKELRTSEHQRRVEASDFTHPLIVTHFNGRFVILDGVHRLVKAYMRGDSKIRAKIIPERELANFAT